MIFRRLLLAPALSIAVACVLAPTAHTEPNTGMYTMVCQTLDNRPSLPAVNRMMRDYSVLLFTRQNAWDTIVGGMADQCPQYADLLRLYAVVYGDG